MGLDNAIKEKNRKKDRIFFIDEVRGFAIACMVVYHLFYDLVVIFGVDFPFFYSQTLFYLVDVFVGIFVFISGTSSEFSRNNLKRGIICFSLGLVMTIATLIFMYEKRIIFGILHMLGVCMIIYALVSPLLKKIKPALLIAISAFLFIITYNITQGYISFFGLGEIMLPIGIYNLGFLFPFGFISSDFYSGDYYSLFPWLFCFIGGTAFGRIIKQKNLSPFFYKKHSKPLAFMGRNTLLIYILHQPIIYGVLYLIFR